MGMNRVLILYSTPKRSQSNYCARGGKGGEGNDVLVSCFRVVTFFFHDSWERGGEGGRVLVLGFLVVTCLFHDSRAGREGRGRGRTRKVIPFLFRA